MTKYVGGHGDALGGIVVGPRDGIHRIREEMLIHLGGAMSPFNAWLLNRGLPTLSLRMQKHQENALAVARFLERHPRIKRVSTRAWRATRSTTWRAPADGGLRRHGCGANGH